MHHQKSSRSAKNKTSSRVRGDSSASRTVKLNQCWLNDTPGSLRDVPTRAERPGQPEPECPLTTVASVRTRAVMIGVGRLFVGAASAIASFRLKAKIIGCRSSSIGHRTSKHLWYRQTNQKKATTQRKIPTNSNKLLGKIHQFHQTLDPFGKTLKAHLKQA
jgi:hypothetical protein